MLDPSGLRHRPARDVELSKPVLDVGISATELGCDLGGGPSSLCVFLDKPVLIPERLRNPPMLTSEESALFIRHGLIIPQYGQSTLSSDRKLMSGAEALNSRTVPLSQ
jgi:hypothetical protein